MVLAVLVPVLGRPVAELRSVAVLGWPVAEPRSSVAVLKLSVTVLGRSVAELITSAAVLVCPMVLGCPFEQLLK